MKRIIKLRIELDYSITTYINDEYDEEHEMLLKSIMIMLNEP
jgi:hypothetical protein